jgi:hypothetical protein
LVKIKKKKKKVILELPRNATQLLQPEGTEETGGANKKREVVW